MKIGSKVKTMYGGKLVKATITGKHGDCEYYAIKLENGEVIYRYAEDLEPDGMTTNLVPRYGQKSFYGKAKVIETASATILKSYDTIVCSFDKSGFHRHWNGYSATTMKHINAFLDMLNIDGGGKKWWIEKPIERFDWIAAYIGKIA